MVYVNLYCAQETTDLLCASQVHQHKCINLAFNDTQ